MATITEPLTIEVFAEEVRSFLDKHFERRSTARQRFTWGVGPERLEIFEEVDPDGEGDRVAEVRRWRRLLWDAGFGWITGPTELGGRGLPGRHQQVFDEVARGYAVPSSAMLTVSLGMVAPTILAHGGAGACRSYLPPMHRGELVGCQLFSEPDAGSDLASVATTAVRDGDGWRITGQKVWTSGAHLSDVGLALCRTGATPRHGGLTMFLVPMHAAEVEVRPLRQMTGGASFNEVFLDGVWVPDDDRLGDVDDGWRVARTTLSNERSAIGSGRFGGTGLLDVDRLVAMAAAFDRCDDPLVRQQLADLVINLRVAKCARARAAGVPPAEAARLSGPIAKLALAMNLLRLSAFVSSVLGPRLAADGGEWGAYAWAGVVLGVPGYRVGGGTDEVLRNVIAERVLGLPGTDGQDEIDHSAGVIE